MRTISTPMATAVAAAITRPGYLIQLDYASTLRLSTYGDVSWNGYSWMGTDAAVSGIGQDGAGNAGGKIALGNTDNAFGALVLNEGASDIGAKVWIFDAGATGSVDPVQVFDGVIDGADIDASKVSFNLVAQRNQTLQSPRRFINQTWGFHFLQPAGTKIAVNGEVFVLERP